MRKQTIRWAWPDVVFGENVSVGRWVKIAVTDGGEVHIGDNTHIGAHSVIVAKRGRIVIGKNTFIGPQTFVVAQEEIIIGEDCLVAERISIRDQEHSTKLDSVPFRSQGSLTRPIHIGRNVWIGANCIVTSGVTVGDSSVIGAGAVVTRDIPTGCLAVGIPAKVIRSLVESTNGEQTQNDSPQITNGSSAI